MKRTVRLRTSEGLKVCIALEHWGSGLDHTLRRWTLADGYWECMDTGELAEESGLSGLKIFGMPGTLWFSYHMRRRRSWRSRSGSSAHARPDHGRVRPHHRRGRCRRLGRLQPHGSRHWLDGERYRFSPDQRLIEPVFLEWRIRKSVNGEVTHMTQDKYLTVAELSEYLHIHRTTIYRMLREGKLPGFRIGSDWRFSLEAIEEWARDQMKTGAGRIS